MTMHLTVYNSFVEIALVVIEKETTLKAQKEKMFLNKSGIASNEINVIIGITGNATGNLLYSMNKATAVAIASKMMEEELTEIDDLVKSSIGELANVITGRGAKELENRGYPITISPPLLLLGSGTMIENLDIPRVDVPILLTFPVGKSVSAPDELKITISMSLKKTANSI